MALPGVAQGETVPSVDDCSRTASPPLTQGWLVCLGMDGWLALESPAGLRRNARLASVGIRTASQGRSRATNITPPGSPRCTNAIHDGYTHETLDRVLASVNLGVVPVLWEDNLPQVAIEMVARGIPILTSDRGGAQEIARNPAFVFRAGRHTSFASKLEEIGSGRLPLARFWDHEPRLVTMDGHVDHLLRCYEAATKARCPRR